MNLENSLLTLKKKEIKNKVIYWGKWDSNDADYIEIVREFDSKDFFENIHLQYLLAYVSIDYRYSKEFSKIVKNAGKGHNDPAFSCYVFENKDIDNIMDILGGDEFDGGYDLIPGDDWGHAHSCEEISLTYYNENGEIFEIGLDKIQKEFESMTYEEICERINSLNTWSGEEDLEDEEDWEDDDDEKEKN